jgi:hypothetical protein
MPFIHYTESGSFHASHAIICTGDGLGCGMMVKVEIDGYGGETDGRAAWVEATNAARELSEKSGWADGRCPRHRKPGG